MSAVAPWLGVLAVFVPAVGAGCFAAQESAHASAGRLDATVAEAIELLLRRRAALAVVRDGTGRLIAGESGCCPARRSRAARAKNAQQAITAAGTDRSPMPLKTSPAARVSAMAWPAWT
ncbi:hypothetical protein ACFW34_33470 [Streptomyces sp. NPDC058848]|uniref:hypothetical protein n=1 Tax=unclassified Streptomyces TaxID=2593676 RepID=UPI0036B583E4